MKPKTKKKVKKVATELGGRLIAAGIVYGAIALWNWNKKSR